MNSAMKDSEELKSLPIPDGTRNNSHCMRSILDDVVLPRLSTFSNLLRFSVNHDHSVTKSKLVESKIVSCGEAVGREE